MKTSNVIRWVWSSRAAVAASALAGSVGCGAEFEHASTVSDVRVLAVQGSPTYAAPGESVALKLLAVDPRGRKLSVAWTTCLNPSSSVVNACFEKIAADTAAGHAPPITTGEGLDEHALVVPADALTSIPTAAHPNATVGVVTVVCPGTITAIESTHADGDLPFACVDEQGTARPREGFVISVKRITVRSRDRNANPGISAITWNGQPWPADETREITACDNDPTLFADCTGGEQVTVGVEAAPGATETGTDEFGTPFTEQVIAQHYAANGAFEADARRSDAPGTKWVARSAARGKDETMWFTLRDDRGGVTWTSRTVHVK